MSGLIQGKLQPQGTEGVVNVVTYVTGVGKLIGATAWLIDEKYNGDAERSMPSEEPSQARWTARDAEAFRLGEAGNANAKNHTASEHTIRLIPKVSCAIAWG